jgi:site-specific recombinase XerD
MDSLSPRRQARLDQTLRRYEAEHLDLRSASPKHRREALALLRRFAASLDHPITELTATDLRRFLGAAMRDKGIKPQSAAKNLSTLRSFITWAYEATLIDQHRWSELSLVGHPRGAHVKSKPNPYTAAEITEFYTLIRARFPLLPEYGRGSGLLQSFQRGTSHRLHHRLLSHAKRLQIEAQVSLALEAGLRRSEIHGVSMAAIHPDNSTVVVRTAKQGPGAERYRSIPFTDHSRYRISQWLDFRYELDVPHDYPWLALGYSGEQRDAQLAPITLLRLGRSLERALGTQYYRWHRFRHTAATEWLRAGVALEKVRVFMGHTNIEDTLSYAQLLEEDVSDAFGAAEASFASRLGLIVPGEAA